MRNLLAAVLALSSQVAAAGDFDFVSNPSQADFARASRDVVAVSSYKALGPAEAGGLTGFSIGAFGSYAETQDASAWQGLTGHRTDALSVVGISARKGLPLGIDLGAVYGRVPGTEAALYGGEVRWAVLPGGGAGAGGGPARQLCAPVG